MEKKLKTLANCKPSEFLVQTNKIRKSVANWLTVTDIENIRRKKADLQPVPDNASEEQKEAIEAANRKARNEQAIENINEMLDSMLDKHPQETLEVLAHVCFVDPSDIDNHPVTYYLRAIQEVITDEEVLNFFTSLVQLASKSGLKV